MNDEDARTRHTRKNKSNTDSRSTVLQKGTAHERDSAKTERAQSRSTCTRQTGRQFYTVTLTKRQNERQETTHSHKLGLSHE